VLFDINNLVENPVSWSFSSTCLSCFN
jgi:hypothetical protein